MEASIINYGDTADIVVNITTAAGKEYFQKYTGIKVDGDLYFCLTVDNSYIEILDMTETDAPKKEEPAPAPEVKTLGAEDCSTAWWTVFTAPVKVESGKSETVKFTNYTSGLEFFHNFAVILKDAANKEYAVTRVDNWGWGAGFDNIAEKESNWNWDTMKTDMNGAAVELTITNNGTTVDVVMDVTTAAGKEYFKKYTGIKIDGDLYYSLTVEKAYLVFE
jgi:hypothetical protein